MSTSQLKLYNGALLVCEERPLTSLTEDVEPRRLLDAVWDNDGVKYCLLQGYWNFAMRAVQLDYDSSIEPPFGYRRAFEKPSDWVRTAAVCTDEYFKNSLLDYQDEVSYLFADIDTIYARYVSDDTSYGMDLSLWPPTFTRYVEHYFASKIAGNLSASSELRESLNTPVKSKNKVHMALVDARSKDAMDEATVFPPKGSWASSRLGRTRRDRGNRGQLIG